MQKPTYKLTTCDTHRVIAFNPETNEIEKAILEEDWFGPGKDAIRFNGFNTPHYDANLIEWDFMECEVSND